MKIQLVAKQPVPEVIGVDAARINSDMYYGFIHTSYLHTVNISGKSRKGFITQSSYRTGNFIPLAAEKVTMGNGFSSYGMVFDDLEELIKKLIEKGYIVYQFDSSYELFAWLGEPESTSTCVS